MGTTNPAQFIQQVRSEVSKVVWPTRREVLLTTVMVFIMSALAAVFLTLAGLLAAGWLAKKAVFWPRRSQILT